MDVLALRQPSPPCPLLYQPTPRLHSIFRSFTRPTPGMDSLTCGTSHQRGLRCIEVCGGLQHWVERRRTERGISQELLVGIGRLGEFRAGGVVRCNASTTDSILQPRGTLRDTRHKAVSTGRPGLPKSNTFQLQFFNTARLCTVNRSW